MESDVLADLKFFPLKLILLPPVHLFRLVIGSVQVKYAESVSYYVFSYMRPKRYFFRHYMHQKLLHF